MAVPDKPAGVSRSVGNAQIAVFFLTNTIGAAVTGYKLLRGTASGGPYGTTVADGLAPGAFSQLSPTQYVKIDTNEMAGLTNGTAYYYVVVAYNSDGDSDYSDEVYGTPLNLTDSAAFQFWQLDNGLLPELTLVAGHQYPSRLFWLNTGTTTWTEDNFYRNAINPNGATTWTAQRHLLRTSESVGPNAVGIFRATIIAPQTPDAYSFDWTVNQEALHVSIGDMPAYSVTVLPAAPNAVEARGGCAEIDVSWSAVIGATGYRVYRRSPETTPWEMIAATVETSHMDGDVMPGRDYDYRVAAVAATGETPPDLCMTVSATSVLPGAVTGLTAVAGDGEVALSWSVAGRATAYRIYRGTAAGSLEATPLVDTVTGQAYTDCAVTNGATYFYAVAATSDCGAGAISAAVSAAPQCCAGAWTGAVDGVTTWSASGDTASVWTAGGEGATAWTSQRCP